MQIHRGSAEGRTNGLIATLMAIAMVLGSSGCGSSAPPPDPALSCAGISQLVLSDTTITKAEFIPANSTPSTLYPNLPDMPGNCLVQGTVNPRIGVPAPPMDQFGNLMTGSGNPNYGIQFELRMPTATWNGDFFFTGGSGNDGVVAEAVGQTLGGGTAFLPALYRGFAVITQNSGHTADAGSDQNDGFGYDPHARYDYGYQQTGTLTPIAKSILQAYYGTGPVHSYYLGCSNGGREAMVASQQWGNLFDGIVAGDPGFRLPHAAIAEAWDTQQFAKAAVAVGTAPDPNGNPVLIPGASQSDLALVGQLVLEACDALDGLQDNMIFNVAACRRAFDPATLGTLQCAGAKTATCLLPEQISAIQKVFSGPVDSQANPLYSNWPYDVDISDVYWRMWTLGYLSTTNNIVTVNYAANDTQGAQSAMYLFSTPPNPFLNMFTTPMDELNTAVNTTDPAFTLSATTYMEATSTDLDTFRANHGKIIFYHGESDPVFSMYDTVQYYENLTSRYGKDTGSFARLFLIPGMNHCQYGGYALDSFDPLTAIVNWVEGDVAPDSMIAGTSPNNTAQPAGRTRPLCPYPKFAQYTGGPAGSEAAASFTCVAPGD
jgi:feruloyl esterase